MSWGYFYISNRTHNGVINEYNTLFRFPIWMFGKDSVSRIITVTNLYLSLCVIHICICIIYIGMFYREEGTGTWFAGITWIVGTGFWFFFRESESEGDRYLIRIWPSGTVLNDQKLTDEKAKCIAGTEFLIPTLQSATRPPVIGYTNFWKKTIGACLNIIFKTGPASKTSQSFKWTEKVYF